MDTRPSFDKADIDFVRKMRTKFFQTGSVEGITNVRPEILACWETYYIYEHSGDKQIKHTISDDELRSAKKDSEELLTVAEPYMNLLLTFLGSENFWITLMNETGIIIKTIGSPLIIEAARLTGLYEGSFRGAGSYPGLFNICMELDKPFQIVSTEQPSDIDDDLAGSAAPIHEIGTGRFLGAIGISGYWWNSHNHTLGLTIMAAEAISQQLALREKSRYITTANQSLDIALETVDFGLVYFHKNGMIRTVNRRAIEMLSRGPLSKDEFMKKDIYVYFDEDSMIQKDRVHEIDSGIAKDGTYTCDAIPAHKYNPLCCTIRKVPSDGNEYLLQIQKRTDLNKVAADIALPHARFTFQDIIGVSAAIESAKNSALIAAKHSPSVLITGESGTGKELFAQAIHNGGPRANGPFVALNCGAIPKSLIESELFGYEAGAFTGAQKAGHQGKFELADKGSLFLDEIGDMPYETQVSLLRVLQTKEVIRIGGKKPIKIDVMIIAATNQDLETRISEHFFRKDLFYRLNVFSIHLSPLRERPEDIEIFCNYFIQKYGRVFDKRVTGISKEALCAMQRYVWPGNVRELENTIERAIIICGSSRIEVEDLPDQIQAIPAELPSNAPSLPSEAQSESEAVPSEQAKFLQALENCSGNLSQTAKYLGISRPTLYRKLKKYNMYPPQKLYGRQHPHS